MSTALYRRYRPDTFAEVIGQEHVTTPLMTALEKNRVNHAYLFSGPRGCGKTTSARILARCLNCAQGPTPTPCGTCPSCVELANGGPGSLDVIEIDAASHGGVEDARDLRERATFAPTRDRYKIFIIDEAHMVTSAGFNALLKIVEEPPPHIKFIFATTEPDKVIGTIRSRTHHYPFRLVPPEALLAYLKTLCERENVVVADSVLPLVIRAGGGSVRDTLSVLDQLMAGAREGGVDYETAIALLGYTHSTLLDEVILSLHEANGASLFGAIDRIIQTGLDPRRFVEDLLERMRDLIIAKAMPEGLEKILRGTPADQLESLHMQASLVGAGELSRWADVTNQALTEMTGATSPRLHLELLAARLMLPGAENSASSFAARLDRLERHAMTGGALPELPEGEMPTQSSGVAPSPAAARQGAAAVREALAAAKLRNGGVESAAQEQSSAGTPVTPAQQPSASQPQTQPTAPAQAQQEQKVAPSEQQNVQPREQEPAPREQQHQEARAQQPSQAQQQPGQPREQQPPVTQEEPDINAPLDPDAARSLNTGEAADWGATWGPKEDLNPVTTPVQPGPSVPEARPEGVAPFSLVPDPAAGEDLSFGTGVSIDDVKQNAAMAEFTRRAAENRPQQAPQQVDPRQMQQQQPQQDQQAQGQAQPQQQAQNQAQEQAAHEARRRAEEQAAREQAEQRAAAERAEQEKLAREQAEQRAAAEREAAAQRAAQEKAAREQAEAQQRAQAARTAQQQAPQQPVQQSTPPAQQSNAAGASVQQFQQAWPAVLEQLQSSSRVLHSMVANYGSVAGFDGRTLTIAFSNTGPIVNLRNRPDMMQILVGILCQVAGQQIEVVLAEGGSAPAGGGSPKGERRPTPASSPAAATNVQAPIAGVAPNAPSRPQPAGAPAPAPAPASKPSPSGDSGYVSSYDDVPPPLDEPYMDEPPYPDDGYGTSGSPAPQAPTVPATGSAAIPQPAKPQEASASSELAAAVLEPVAPAPRGTAPRSFDGPPVAPRPRLTAGLSARQAEVGAPVISRPVSSTPLHPGSTTDTFESKAIREPEPEAPTPAPVAPEPVRVAPPKPSVQPATESAPAWGAPGEPAEQPIAEAPAPTAGQRLSRYQQLMSQAKDSAPAVPVESSASNWGTPDRAQPPSPAPEPEEFTPSEDDIEVEDSALIGVPAVERLLGGMVIEQRDVNGNVVEIKRGL
ncbi:DNA polymerase III subunit gamma and tau [Glutamicibacter sp. AOP12-B1-11]|uniref:DNA polymerase III subunit gamma and tau n=1 Tax=Glutamicibacter sp. AOP12-B1-11 TaxID=3457725 RepID=UPI0040337E8E